MLTPLRNSVEPHLIMMCRNKAGGTSDGSKSAPLPGRCLSAAMKEHEVERVEKDLYVSVHYNGTLENGEVFDSSQGRRPLEVRMGAGQVIEGFERELFGMSLNEKKTFTLDPEEAYGQRDDKLRHDFSRSEVPSHMNLEVGMTIGLQTNQGRQVPAQVVHLDDETVTVDLNHPLAGESLTFEVEVVGISETPTQKPSGCGAGCDCSSGSCD